MKRYIIATILILAVVGCAASGVVQQALTDAGGGMVWKALAASGIVYSASASDQAIPCYDGTTGHTIQTTSCYIDDDNHLGVNVASAVGDIAARLHARESGSSIITPTDTVLAVQNNATSATNCFAAFSSGDTGKSILYFGHPTDYDRGGLEYDCATDDMRFFAADDVKLEGDNVRVDCGDIYANGHLRVGEGTRINRVAISANRTMTATDYYIGVTTRSAVTISLQPAATAGEGRMLIVKAETPPDVTNPSITIDADGSETIDGVATYVVNRNCGVVRLMCDGTSWWTI